MTKVSNLWSWFLKRIRDPKKSNEFGNPYMEMPPIPSHKPPTDPGFSVVLINERRGPTQFNLRGKNFHFGVAFTAIIVVLSVFGVYSIIKGLLGHTVNFATGYKRGAANIAALQSTDQDKSNTASNLEKDYLDPAGSGGKRSGSYGESNSADVTRFIEQESLVGGSGTAVRSSAEKLEGDLSESIRQSQGTHDSSASNVGSAMDTKKVTPRSTAKSEEVGPEGSLSSGPILNFNAQDVTVKPSGTNSGALSFRLVKDHPDTLFAGYLFVFVEMRDKRGETKIYVYPDKTRLGEGDLPSDFRQGENISFKYNSRVELPYGDIRSGAVLARVSILLYGDDGRIVFQRGFEKKELLVSSPSGPQRTDGSKSKPTEKRRVL